MRTFRILLLILGCYLAGWITADLLVPVVVAGRTEQSVVGPSEAFAQADRPLSHSTDP